MAEKSLFLHILFVSTFSLYLIRSACSPSLSSSSTSESQDHSHSHSHTTTLFDVSASVQRTLDVLSFDPDTQKPTRKVVGPTTIKPLNISSYFSLSLHPRSSLLKAHHEDYRSLTLSRLNRDVARVNSISAKLEGAVDGVSRRPEKFQTEDLETPVTSGVRQGSGEYFTRIGVGRPAREYYMVVDTGSDVSWLQCKPCSDCYQQSDPVFDPSGSSTYRSVTCNSPQCEALDTSACGMDGSCLYGVAYGDGSTTVGDFATETLSFGRSGSVNDFAIGCGHDNEGLFVAAAGLLGLGRGSLSLPSQLKASSFSYCLVDRDSSGSSTLEFNSARPGDSVTAPLIRNSQTTPYLYVGLTGISVGGKPVDIPPSLFAVDGNGGGGVIVDSGTPVSRLKTQAYDALRDDFRSQTRDLPSASGVEIFDTCYDLSSKTTVRVPTVSFQFSSGKTLTLPAKNYLIPVDSSGTVCFAFAPINRSPSILGSIQQQGTRVSYDLANSLVGFSPDKC